MRWMRLGAARVAAANANAAEAPVAASFDKSREARVSVV